MKAIPGIESSRSIRPRTLLLPPPEKPFSIIGRVTLHYGRKNWITAKLLKTPQVKPVRKTAMIRAPIPGTLTGPRF